MSLHVIVGAGTIGSAAARLLAESGESVRVVSRRGSGPEHALIERVAADATDAGRLADLTGGAAALYNCANPRYHRWPVDWPPIAAALLSAAERSGAVLVTTSNLYGYGPVDGAMTEDLPLRPTTVKGGVRARMWHDALAAHEAGRVRATEVRASDYVGANAKSVFTDIVAPSVLRGRAALVPATVDLPHSWTYTVDTARTLVAVGTDPRAWGRAWHAPTNPPVSIRDLAGRLASIAGVPAPRLRRMPGAVLWLGGLFSPEAKAFREMRYQFDAPFVLDSTLTEKTFGLAPTPLDVPLRELAAESVS